MDAVQESFNLMMEAFNQRLDSIQEQLPSASSSPGSLSAEFAAFKSFVVATFRAVQSQIALLAQQIDQGETRARRKFLLLHGIPEKQSEDVSEAVTNALTKALKLSEFSPGDISKCHRMGRVTGDRSRPILFKLRDVNLRDKIWSSKTGLKGSGVTLSEFLTKARHDVFVAARQLFGVSKCWTREGNIFVLGPDGTRHRISSTSDLSAIQPKDTPVAAAVRLKTAAKAMTSAAAEATKMKSKRVIVPTKK